MKIVENKFGTKTITPDNGYLLANHDARTVSDEAILGINADASEWAEITISEAEELQKTWEEEIEQ